MLEVLKAGVWEIFCVNVTCLDSYAGVKIGTSFWTHIYINTLKPSGDFVYHQV
jgi:hypothetical protein